jgi:hypothetical protein
MGVLAQQNLAADSELGVLEVSDGLASLVVGGDGAEVGRGEVALGRGADRVGLLLRGVLGVLVVVVGGTGLGGFELLVVDLLGVLADEGGGFVVGEGVLVEGRSGDTLEGGPVLLFEVVDGGERGLEAASRRNGGGPGDRPSPLARREVEVQRLLLAQLLVQPRDCVLAGLERLAGLSELLFELSNKLILLANAFISSGVLAVSFLQLSLQLGGETLLVLDLVCHVLYHLCLSFHLFFGGFVLARQFGDGGIAFVDFINHLLALFLHLLSDVSGFLKFHFLAFDPFLLIFSQALQTRDEFVFVFELSFLRGDHQ